MKKISFLVCCMVPFFALAQSNLTITNPTALNILKGIYTPITYNPASVSQLPGDIIQGIKDDVSQDSIKKTFAVMPGNWLADNSVLIFLAHADSRAASSCTATSVSAKGMEDNASG